MCVSFLAEFVCSIDQLAGFGYFEEEPLESEVGITESACSDLCSTSDECAAATYDVSAQACWLHDKIWMPTANGDWNYWSKSCPDEALPKG